MSEHQTRPPVWMLLLGVFCCVGGVIVDEPWAILIGGAQVAFFGWEMLHAE